MADGGLTILDGALLRETEVSLPHPSPDSAITGKELLELAETRASLSPPGFVLPETIKSSALRRIGVCDAEEFRTKELNYSDALSTFRNYISAVADELRDDPIVVAILDGKNLQILLEDEDDFAMLAENLFTDLDVEDRGKISKDGIQRAVVNMGVELGIPPVSEFPQLSDILKRHGAEGKEELGQAQFAHLLQPVIQELADRLAKNPVVVVQHIKVVNGSKLRKVLADEKLLDAVVKKIMQEKYEGKSERSSATKVRCFLEKNGNDVGLPPSELVDTEVLFDEIFAEVDSQNDADKSEKDGFVVLLKEILEIFAEKLDANPVLYEA